MSEAVAVKTESDAAKYPDMIPAHASESKPYGVGQYVHLMGVWRVLAGLGKVMGEPGVTHAGMGGIWGSGPVSVN